jgi:hypothetical protein
VQESRRVGSKLMLAVLAAKIKILPVMPVVVR